ncbi:hypothetical protein [Tetragenococcus halophilus]|uniref:Uncharacterized protein n=4 Tax=Tetragenococcus halophilus TaxID=51669 RepID=A0A2H6CNJ8_TETHA|nr:hypothetical protein [Tetragenococcus halophilus]MDN6474020.1 hypothetical protein [Lactococcus lactis]MDN6502862.1 hypothetical protein [Tetragenococcus koreensis]AYW50069.1 hypothetical protein C7H83_06130 [Tetragenococcus halophilus]MCF1602125.1 hypothetical protein [Tetragenococcus halophilus]MCF1676819.1 hypothetical protein [Tetragenococcus halophilus]
MVEKKGYILLTDTGTLFTKFIRLYTHQPYNHASIAFTSDLSEIYSFGRKHMRNPFVGGFVEENIATGLLKKADCALYSFDITQEQLEQMELYIEQIKAEKEYYHYNFIGLFGFLINKPIKRDHVFFCSQFVASVLAECEFNTFEKPLSLVAPQDLKEIPTLQLEFQGKLSDYYENYLQHECKSSFLPDVFSVEI